MFKFPKVEKDIDGNCVHYGFSSDVRALQYIVNVGVLNWS